MAAKKTTSRTTRPANLPHGRWLSDLEPPKLRLAEKAVLVCAAKGEVWRPKGWDGRRPEEATNANRIRADLIRFLILGGDAKHPVHENGVWVDGAWIEGELQLRQVKVSLILAALNCYFDQAIEMSEAQISSLLLNGSRFLSINAQGIETTGSVFFRDVHCERGISLAAATIGKVLACEEAVLKNCDDDGNVIGFALNADSAGVTGHVSLDAAKCDGGVSFLGAKIGGGN